MNKRSKAASILGKLKLGVTEKKSDKKAETCRANLQKARLKRWLPTSEKKES